jgi:hypothetical protein
MVNSRTISLALIAWGLGSLALTQISAAIIVDSSVEKLHSGRFTSLENQSGNLNGTSQLYPIYMGGSYLNDGSSVNYDGNEPSTGTISIDGASSIWQTRAMPLIELNSRRLNIGATLSGAVNLPANEILFATDISGDLTNGGKFRPGHSPAEASIDGQFIQTAAGILEMELGPSLVSYGYDRIIFGDSVTLDGTLEVVSVDGLTPQSGDTFSLFEWNDHLNGTEFAQINLPILTNGLDWDLSNLYTAGTLSVVPEPTMGMLIFIGTVGWIFFSFMREKLALR